MVEIWLELLDVWYIRKNRPLRNLLARLRATQKPTKREPNALDEVRRLSCSGQSLSNLKAKFGVEE